MIANDTGDFADDKRFWKLYDDFNCADPVPLTQESANLKSFVYHRRFGLFECSFGRHPSSMSLLFAIHMGYENGIDAAQSLGLEYSSGTAEAFLKLEGTAFRSSQSGIVEAWDKSKLNKFELMCFGKVRLIGHNDHHVIYSPN